MSDKAPIKKKPLIQPEMSTPFQVLFVLYWFYLLLRTDPLLTKEP